MISDFGFVRVKVFCACLEIFLALGLQDQEGSTPCPTSRIYLTYSRDSFRRFETRIKGRRHICPWVNLGSHLQSIGNM